MAKIIKLDRYIIGKVETGCFKSWQRRFKEPFDKSTRPVDLKDRTLYLLAMPGEESAVAFYDLIMSVLEFGGTAGFDFLPKKEQLRVLDVQLFLADQVRFEIMRRLGWIESFSCQDESFINLILFYEKIKRISMENPPKVSYFSPAYEDYLKFSRREKEIYIRRLLVAALEKFKEKIGQKP